MNELIEFIKADNNNSREKMANSGWIIGLLVEDESWWAKRNIYTVDDFKRWEMESVMSDLAKDAYGTRSMCPDTANMTFAEVEAAYDSLLIAAQDTADKESEAQKEAVTYFENKLAELVVMGAKDRETAIRWLREGDQDEQLLYDDDYFEYNNNLPYGYLNSTIPKTNEA